MMLVTLKTVKKGDSTVSQQKVCFASRGTVCFSIVGVTLESRTVES